MEEEKDGDSLLREIFPCLDEMRRALETAVDEGQARAILRRHGVDEQTASHLAAHHFHTHRGGVIALARNTAG